MFYLASGYEERVGEVFESRETRLNAWKGARVQRMHVRARGCARGLRTCARLADGCVAGGCVSGRAAVLGYCSPESTVFTQNEEFNLK
ncbi:hypothetical protein CDL15_Pgr023823 [Punica granatum]|uniref:Uncharacterized protein n=1 Tax=Punica granatum TaxID=22663 RepID=A0A218VZ32_PUNGR|nr:hypothetical protein CDL15_Pgr023823 [Punica granatum]PKI41992.1 hypothetical protein CRG98_037610 [Punica granatum]